MENNSICVNLEDAEKICKDAFQTNFYNYVNGCSYSPKNQVFIYLTEGGFLKYNFFRPMKQDSVKRILYRLHPVYFDDYDPEESDDIDQDAEIYWEVEGDYIVDSVMKKLAEDYEDY